MQYYEYSSQELIEKSNIFLESAQTNEIIFKAMADEMTETIVKNNLRGEPTVMICPVGPIGHYPYFVERINKENISLRNVWIINMDEYLDDHQQWINENHPLSFRGFMNREVYNLIRPELVMPLEQRIFPDPLHLDHISEVIDKLGKVDACFGGIGINGHVAFNEPDESLSQEAFLSLSTRVLRIDPMTIAVNSIGDLNGAIEMMPKWCVTIGMKEIFQSRKIRLGVFRDWHRAVLRRAVCGDPSVSFPVTLLQGHQDIKIYASQHVLTI